MNASPYLSCNDKMEMDVIGDLKRDMFLGREIPGCVYTMEVACVMSIVVLLSHQDICGESGSVCRQACSL